jgi:uncharacterized membrane protein YgaE (UPF0421/DUF939 family)
MAASQPQSEQESDIQINDGTKQTPKEDPKVKSRSQKCKDWAETRAEAIWTNLQSNHLWQRILKNTLATTLTIILAMIPAVVKVYGRATYLAPITTVFGHPGRRFGMMAEALILAIAGTLLGTGWSTLGMYLSSLVYPTNAPAAYTIKGVFLVVALMFHGVLRSHTPRLFIMVLLLIIVVVVTLTGTGVEVSATLITTLLYPILTASAILLLVNVCIFPEFSSSFLGITTIETLGETIGALRDAGSYFTAICQPDDQPGEKTLPVVKSESHGIPLTAAESVSRPAQPFFQRYKTIFQFKFMKRSHKPSSNGHKDKSSPVEEDDGEKEAPSPPEPEKPKVVKLKSLTDQKANLRAKLASCKAAQTECNFELTFAVLPPRDLKAISDTKMNSLVANTISLIGACESKYALMGDEQDDSLKDEEPDGSVPPTPSGYSTPKHETSADESSSDEKEKARDENEKLERKRKKKKKSKAKLEKDIENLELVKPRKEIEFGDVELLRYLVQRIEKPLVDLQANIDKTVDVVTSCLAYCYDVPKLPNGSRSPKGIDLKEIDIWMDSLSESIADFDVDSTAALEGAVSFHDLEGPQIDIMPRMETFLISSFLLNLRQAAIHTQEMLAHCRKLVEKRQKRHERRRLYAPRINWRKWLSSGGEEDALALPSNARKDARSGSKNVADDDASSTHSKGGLLKPKKSDEEVANGGLGPVDPVDPHSTQKAEQKVKKAGKKRSTLDQTRNKLADSLEYLSGSEDVLYAIKLTVAVFLVTWPAFLAKWNAWYSLNRGLWAALQLVLITEVSLGTSVFTFLLRAAGTTLGCVWGYAAYQARNGNRFVCVIMLVIGIIPSAYVQLGSKYVKAGMVSIISMCIVALATIDKTVPGTSTENFLRRLVAFLIGGIVALIVEVVLFPVRARDRLVESLATSIRQISEMEACLAYGIETEVNFEVSSEAVSERFDSAKSKAQGALEAAETFLPFCAQEPRLKGSFAGLALVYTEILYVLHQIVDRMDNMLQLRKEYGSGVLEELNVQVYQYRRNVAGSITIILFAVHEALTTKLPLPQFLPSARLAHLRMVNRVREVMLSKVHEREEHQESMRSQIELALVKRVVRQKFLSWNAASAGQIEVIEYLEELIDLTKLLVGANEFRSGMLTRPTFRDYMDNITSGPDAKSGGLSSKSNGATNNELFDEERRQEQEELRDAVPLPEARKLGLRNTTTRRRTVTNKSVDKSVESGTATDAAKRQKQEDEDELPKSLQRVRSRRVEEKHDLLVRVKSGKAWEEGKEGKKPQRRTE